MRPTVPSCAALCNKALQAAKAGLHGAWLELRALDEHVDPCHSTGAASRALPLTAHAHLAVGTLMIPETQP
ncbi:hypothetical protein [Pseudomonas sp. NPDC089401]|uniref:hypothetical protein n=1 Tax=Pseudomonas sp. NPDC089401 TaxID=3364462 RepID=UPI00380FC30A